MNFRVFLWVQAKSSLFTFKKGLNLKSYPISFLLASSINYELSIMNYELNVVSDLHAPCSV
jgi:hypothetical protein